MAMSGKFDPKMLSALDLAFVGDGVYGLLVREMLARDGSRPVGELHRMAVAYVNATAQAAAYDRIAPLLTEQEQAVYRPGPQRWGPSAQKRRPGPLCQGDRAGGAFWLPVPEWGAGAGTGAF